MGGGGRWHERLRGAARWVAIADPRGFLERAATAASRWGLGQGGVAALKCSDPARAGPSGWAEVSVRCGSRARKLREGMCERGAGRPPRAGPLQCCRAAFPRAVPAAAPVGPLPPPPPARPALARPGAPPPTHAHTCRRRTARAGRGRRGPGPSRAEPPKQAQREIFEGGLLPADPAGWTGCSLRCGGCESVATGESVAASVAWRLWPNSFCGKNLPADRSL